MCKSILFWAGWTGGLENFNLLLPSGFQRDLQERANRAMRGSCLLWIRMCTCTQALSLELEWSPLYIEMILYGPRLLFHMAWYLAKIAINAYLDGNNGNKRNAPSGYDTYSLLSSLSQSARLRMVVYTHRLELCAIFRSFMWYLMMMMMGWWMCWVAVSKVVVVLVALNGWVSSSLSLLVFLWFCGPSNAIVWVQRRINVVFIRHIAEGLKWD